VHAVTVIGCVQVDLLLAPVAELPAAGASAFVEGMGLRAGGAGANSALALLEAGMAPRLVGAVGNDHFGRWLLETLGEFGLTDDVVVDPEQPTGVTVAVEAPGRERSFLTYLGVTRFAGEEIVGKAGRDLQRRSGGWVVTKLGADGCVAFGPHAARLDAQAPAISPEDTTGAGDAFNAGLLAALARGEDWPGALAAANDLAARLLARPSSARHVRA